MSANYFSFSSQCFVSTLAQAQISTFTGTVTDIDDGSPLIGAAVVVKGGSQGVITDANGDFSLDSELGRVIMISYIGFKNSRN